MTDVEHISRKGTGVPISWFPVPDEFELPEGLQGLFRKAREQVGFVPNVFRAYSYRPERLSAWFAHYRQLHEPTENLDAAEREMIAVAVSMANGCLYRLVAHGAALREALGDPILADRITLDHRRAGLDERRTAILDFAVKITERPLECGPDDLERLKTFGLTEEEVWDVVEMSCSVYKPRVRIARPAYGTRHTASRTRECLEESDIIVSLLNCCAAWLALPRPAFRRNTTDACDPGHQIVDKSTDKPGILSLTDSKVGSV